jgi:bromodomain-containing protein 7/9
MFTLQADFKLMCGNCMTYNHPETIYFKEAEKMLKTGLRVMSKVSTNTWETN